MSKSNAFETDVLALLFNATPIANLVGLSSLYVSLHTADPGEAGNQSSNEIAYTGYSRVAVARTSSGFAVSGNTVNPVGTVSFPVGTGGSGTATHFGIGTSPTGSGELMYSGAITSPIVCGSGITPQLTPATAVTED